MIDTGFVQMMARYSRWQNQNLFDAADGLSEAAREADRGAFFGSVRATLSHVLWADVMWMSRLSDWEPADCGLAESPSWITDWADLKTRRMDADDRIVHWADSIDISQLAGELSFYSASVGAELRRPRAKMVVHFFNHQTHHRGQVHAMLTAAGARPSDTDILVMPEDL